MVPVIEDEQGQVLDIGRRTRKIPPAIRRVLELRPKHAGALLGLGHVLKTMGRQEEAIESYRKCIAAKPDKGEIYWSLANLKTYQLSDDDIADIHYRFAAVGIHAARTDPGKP